MKMRIHRLDQFEVEFADELTFSNTGSTISASPPRRLAMR